MPERAVPRALAIAARLLLDSGKTSRAAVIIGSANAAGADSFLTPELPRFEEMAAEASQALGDKAAQGFAGGAEVELPDLLAKAAGWLED